MNPLYPEKRIHTRSFPHVSTERLLARLDFLRAHWQALSRACEQKSDYRAHVREVVNIERELTHRQLPLTYTPLTDWKHVSLCRDVRVIYPPRPWRETNGST